MKSLRVLLHAAAVVSLAACASGGGGNNSTVAPTPDPRVGLKPGLKDAGQAAWNLKLRSEEHTSELQSQSNLVCRLLLEKKKKKTKINVMKRWIKHKKMS